MARSKSKHIRLIMRRGKQHKQRVKRQKAAAVAAKSAPKKAPAKKVEAAG